MARLKDALIPSLPDVEQFGRLWDRSKMPWNASAFHWNPSKLEWSTRSKPTATTALHPHHNTNNNDNNPWTKDEEKIEKERKKERERERERERKKVNVGSIPDYEDLPPQRKRGLPDPPTAASISSHRKPPTQTVSAPSLSSDIPACGFSFCWLEKYIYIYIYIFYRFFPSHSSTVGATI